MSRIPSTTLYVLSCLALCLLAVSCASEPQIQAARDVAAVVLAATDPAGPGGAAITAEEEAGIAEAFARARSAEGMNWREVGAGAVAALATVIPALRLLPSRWILGSAPDPDVKRAAGLPA